MSKDFSKPFEEGQESEFNSAMASLMRIDGILQECNLASSYAITGSYIHLKIWHSKLWVFYKDLSSYIVTKKQTEILTKLNEIKKIGKIIVEKKTDNGKIHVRNELNYRKTVRLMAETEQLLRKNAADCRMLITMKKDEEDFDKEW